MRRQVRKQVRRQMKRQMKRQMRRQVKLMLGIEIFRMLIKKFKNDVFQNQHLISVQLNRIWVNRVYVYKKQGVRASKTGCMCINTKVYVYQMKGVRV